MSSLDTNLNSSTAQEIVNWVTTADGCIFTVPTRRNATSLSANLFRLVETVANQLRIPYTPPMRLNSTVESRRRRRCVLGLSANNNRRTPFGSPSWCVIYRTFLSDRLFLLPNCAIACYWRHYIIGQCVQTAVILNGNLRAKNLHRSGTSWPSGVCVVRWTYSGSFIGPRCVRGRRIQWTSDCLSYGSATGVPEDDSYSYLAVTVVGSAFIGKTIASFFRANKRVNIKHREGLCNVSTRLLLLGHMRHCRPTWQLSV